MAPRLRRTAALLLICVACKAPGAAGAQPNSNEKLLDPIRVDATSFGTLRNGSVGAGCALCRDSGNCSVAASDAASGVFCGDLHTSATVQPCCCPYYTECRVTNESVACECGGAWPFASELELQQRERLTAADPANNNTEAHDSDVLETDGVNDDMALSTEILIHLSAYLGLFVFAVYVDQWVDCFSDCRRNQMVAYGPGTSKRTLRFRRRFGKRRRGSDAGEDLESDDKRPLLVVTPSPTPLIASPSTGDFDAAAFVDAQEQVVVVTIPADALQEVGDRHVNQQEQHAAATL